MAEFSKIAWTTHTHNHWEGCTKVGPGCDGCYAAARNDRFHAGVNWGPGAPRRLTSIQNRNRPRRWQREAEAAGVRVRVFCSSLADVFDNEVPVEWRMELYRLIYETPNLDWILVTKRVGNVAKMLGGMVFPKNVIVVATIVNQDEADRDMPKLEKLKADGCVTKIGVSYEPALGPVEWLPWLANLDWLIVGGESTQGSHKARQFQLEWASRAINETRGTGCAVFIKQLGSNPVFDVNDELTKFTVSDKAGADTDEWPEFMRVREFPVIGGGNA